MSDPDKLDEHYRCGNCEQAYCYHYSNDNKICAGVVKKVDPELPFDVIRLCINTTSEDEPMVSDFTPDEASSVITTLSHALGDWMTGTEAYQKFRGITDDVSDAD